MNSATVFKHSLRFPRYVTAVVMACMLASIMPAKDVEPTPTTPTESKPTITVIGGDNQTGAPGKFNAKPFDIAVWDSAGLQPLVDTEVTFTVQSGGGMLARSKDAAGLPTYTLTLKTDEDGTVQAFYQQPLALGMLSQIKASSGSAEIVLDTTSLAASDSSFDGSDGTSANSTGVTSSGRSDEARAVLAGLIASSRQAHANAAKAAQPTLRALTLPASSVKIRTPGQAYAINTASWEITTTTP